MMNKMFYNINTCNACITYGGADVVVVVVVVVAVVQVEGVVYVGQYVETVVQMRLVRYDTQ